MELDCNSLRENLNQMRSKLSVIDESIKRLTGNNDSSNTFRNSRTANKRSLNSIENEQSIKRTHIPIKKRLTLPNIDDENNSIHLADKQLISKIIPTSREAPKREEILRAQNADENQKARNRRIFLSLMGTLQQFRMEESKMKVKEQKRAEVEKKLEEQEIKEKEEIRQEKINLFNSKKLYQSQINALQKQIERVSEFNEWKLNQNQLKNFIQTQSKPQIFYLPKTLNDKNNELLETRKKIIDDLIQKRKDELNAENEILVDIKKEDENRNEVLMSSVEETNRSQSNDDFEESIDNNSTNNFDPLISLNTTEIKTETATEIEMETETNTELVIEHVNNSCELLMDLNQTSNINEIIIDNHTNVENCDVINHDNEHNSV